MADCDLKQVESVLSKLEGWYTTWYTYNHKGSFGVGGLIATFWNSSWYASIPHILNVVGVIRGLCYRANDREGDQALRRAGNLVEFLLRCQDPTTGLFTAGWGDIPYKKTGLIHQTMAVASLWDYFKVSGENEVREAAEKAESALRCCISWNVINQVLRYVDTVDSKAEALGGLLEVDKKRAMLLGRSIIELQFKTGDTKGAFPQSLAGEDVIAPYQGKCLMPLIKMWWLSGDDVYMDAALLLAKFIEEKLLVEVGNGYLLGGFFLPKGASLSFWRKLYNLRRLLPFTERPIRVRRKSAITNWYYSKYPIWIARSADTALGYYMLWEATQVEKWLNISMDITRAIISYQTPVGGIRNTLGFFGYITKDERPVWQDVAPITRWNAYVIQLLHYLLRGRAVRQPKFIKNERDEMPLANNLKYVEDRHSVSVNKDTGEIIWKIEKRKRWGRPRIPISHWDEGNCQREKLI